ncbi:hypothetical protein ACIBJF_48720 [Streptomyces sp. NPDC050743]|uniref:hypothetical protein n=1 Tax=Streptomyces sp. NPDC050743 TaxID=3365634 RepID=UPI00378DDBEF
MASTAADRGTELAVRLTAAGLDATRSAPAGPTGVDPRRHLRLALREAGQAVVA